jgi:hypothetical protein
MAAEAAAAVSHEFGEAVLAPLQSDAPVAERVAAIAGNLDRFYDRGRRYCLLDMLTVGDPGPGAVTNLAAAATAWVGVFAELAREAGADAPTALARAQDAIAAIEGGLVLARATGDRRAFGRAIAGLAERLTGTGSL